MRNKIFSDRKCTIQSTYTFYFLFLMEVANYDNDNQQHKS